MNYRAISLAFLGLFLAGMIWASCQHARHEAGNGSASVASRLAGPQESLIESGTPLHHFTIMDPRGNVAGYIFLTRELAPEVLGYGGHIPMAVRTDPAGQIQSIQLLPNNETPAYVRRLDIIVQKLVGQRPGDELPPASKVDAIAGATVSSQAVALTIRKSLAVFAGKVLAAPATSIAPASRVAWHKLLFPILVFLLVLAAILSARRELHWFAMAAGFVYFGIMTAGMLSIVQVANLGLLNIPDFAANPSWWLTIVFAFLSALVIGRAHCAAACPFALVQEALHILLRRRLPAPGVTPALDRRARYLKYFFLLTLLAATFILGNTSAANIEPFVTLFCGHGTRLAWALLILMLILSIFRFRFWCVYLCPVGALTGLTARLALFQIRLKENCYQCRQCSSICPVQAISHKPDSATTVVVDNAECILCGRCIRGCPEGKLTLSVCHEKTRRAV